MFAKPALARVWALVIAVLGAVALAVGSVQAAQALTVLASVATEAQPTSVVYMSNGQYAFVLTGLGVQRIRLSDNTVVGSLIHTAGARNMVIKPDGSWLFVLNRSGHNIMAINTATNAVTTYPFTLTWAPPASEVMSPTQGVLSPDGNELFVTNDTGDNMARLDVSDPTAVPVPRWLDVSMTTQAIAYNALYPDADPLHPHRPTLYVASATGGYLQAVDVSSGGFVTDWFVSVTWHPDFLQVSPDGQFFYYSSTSIGKVQKRNYFGNTVSPGVSGVLSSPGAFVLSPDGTQLFVNNRDTNQILSLNTSTMVSTPILSPGNAPTGVFANASVTNFFTTLTADDRIVRFGTPDPLPDTGFHATQNLLTAWIALTVIGMGALTFGSAQLIRRRQRQQS